jgi:hypothetical protein
LRQSVVRSVGYEGCGWGSLAGVLGKARAVDAERPPAARNGTLGYDEQRGLARRIWLNWKVAAGARGPPRLRDGLFRPGGIVRCSVSLVGSSRCTRPPGPAISLSNWSRRAARVTGRVPDGGDQGRCRSETSGQSWPRGPTCGPAWSQDTATL